MREFIWKTADGRELKLNQIDDQHLSNIYWFQKVFWDYTHPIIQKEIVKRFNKQIPLTYKPLPISGEVRDLKNKGLIIGTDIIFKGLVIGTIKHIKDEY
jgi:hypothetical protein